MKPNTKFELSIEDVALIENTLNNQIGELSKKHWTHPQDSNEHMNKIKEIRELLGKIHNQKVWYRPKKKVYVGG